MKIKVLKVIILTLIATFVLSLSVVPCFAYGAERDPFNSIISKDWLVSPFNWDVTFTIDGESQHGDQFSTYVNFKFDPVFPFAGRTDVLFSNTSDSTSSIFYMPNAGYNDAVTFDFDTSYDYSDEFLGLVDIEYDYFLTANEIGIWVSGVQFQSGQFYYTYQADVVPSLDIPSPFMFDFQGASGVNIQVYYHELGNAVDLLTVSFTNDASGEIAFTPDLFGYSEDKSFTLFIDRVVVIPDYVYFLGDLDFQYAYDGVYCEFSRASDLNTHVSPPSDAVFADYTSWIGLAVSGFLEFQIFEGFSFGALLMVIISFSTVMWFLKLFAGG